VLRSALKLLDVFQQVQMEKESVVDVTAAK